MIRANLATSAHASSRIADAVAAEGPPLASSIGASLEARLPLPFTYESAGRTQAMKPWVAAVVNHDPVAGAVFTQLGKILRGPNRPATVRELIDLARSLARSHAGVGGGAKVEALRTADLLALTAAAGHLLQIEGEARDGFPPYIPDGRPGSLDCDRAWHLVGQCFFAFLWRYSATYGDPDSRAALAAMVEAADEGGHAAPVAAAYDRTRGAYGPLVDWALHGPPGVTDAPYFTPPADLSAEEREAYRRAVELSDAYEHHTTKGPYEPARLGTHPAADDPLARVEGRLHVFSGLADSWVNGDLTANRVGAFIGVSLFRDPAAPLAVPFDDGPAWSKRPYRERKALPFADHYAEESVMLARLGGLTGGAATLDTEAHRKWARDAGPQAAKQELLRKLKVQVQRVASRPDDSLARFYANYAVRQLRWRVPMGGGPIETFSFEAHYNFARRATPAKIYEELAIRVDRMWSRTEPSS